MTVDGAYRNEVVIIVGAGVAGLTAAITAAEAGFSPVVLEREGQIPKRPGETFHPGIEPIFKKLGIARRIPEMAAARPMGIAVRADGAVTKVPYGGPPEAPWRGFQIRRDVLCEMLKARAEALGAMIRYVQGARSILSHDDDSIAIETTGGRSRGIGSSTHPARRVGRRVRIGRAISEPLRLGLSVMATSRHRTKRTPTGRSSRQSLGAGPI